MKLILNFPNTDLSFDIDSPEVPRIDELIQLVRIDRDFFSDSRKAYNDFVKEVEINKGYTWRVQDVSWTLGFNYCNIILKNDKMIWVSKRDFSLGEEALSLLQAFVSLDKFGTNPTATIEHAKLVLELYNDKTKEVKP